MTEAISLYQLFRLAIAWLRTSFGANAVDDPTCRVVKLFGEVEVTELIELANRFAGVSIWLTEFVS